MYSVFTRLEDDEYLFIASRESIEQARGLMRDLKTNWPHDYVVRDSKGDDVDTIRE